MTGASGGQGIVTGIFVAHAAGEPIEERAEVEAVAGVGLRGDRYATRRGFWSDPRWADQQITFVEAEVAESLGLEPHALRRNVVTRGLSLLSLVGVDFRVGTAVFRGVRPCDPCYHLEAMVRPGLVASLAGRGGLRAAILVSGRIANGDCIELVEQATAEAEAALQGGRP